MMAVPIFTFSLNQKILPGRVTIGKYDGTHSCLTAATTADKVQDCVSFFFLSSPCPFLLAVHDIIMFCD
jgi:hypothetical protein